MSMPQSNPFRENSTLESVSLSMGDSAGNDIFSDPSVQQHVNEGDAFLSSAAVSGGNNSFFESSSGGGIPSSEPATTRSQPSETGGGVHVSSMGARLCAFLSIDYYKPYFNVSTADVQARIVASLMPWKVDFFNTIGDRPDLYGPLWILTTLVFLVGATSNISLWLAFRGNDTDSFESDFYLLTFAASVVYGCGVAMPVLAWSVLYYTGVEGFSAANLMCIYGYSITVFLPASVLCIIPSSMVQWLTVTVAFAMSATFLLRNLWGELSGHVLPHLGTEGSTPEGRKKVMLMLGGLIGLHLVFALLMKMYFFGNTYDYMPITAAPTTTTAPSTAAP